MVSKNSRCLTANLAIFDDFSSAPLQNELIIQEPRVRKQTARYGNQDSILNMSELDTSSDDSDKEGKNGEDGAGGEKNAGDDATRKAKKEKGSKKGGRKKRAKLANPGDPSQPAKSESLNGYLRSEMFKVEKNILIYGWGRWDDILLHGRFKRRLGANDVETIAKAMVRITFSSARRLSAWTFSRFFIGR